MILYGSRRISGKVAVAAVLLFSAAFPVGAEENAKSVADFTKAMRKLDGFLPLYWDNRSGKLHLEISHFDQEMIYITSLPTGLGSNDVGLDRGEYGDTRIVRFERVGPK